MGKNRMTSGASETAVNSNGTGTWQRVRLAARGALCAAALVVTGWVAVSDAQAFVPGPAVAGFPVIKRAELPEQGRDVLTRIENGDSFEHPKDGSVFGNRERLLPKQTRGYYREYTVPTPGLKHRGAKRIVCGGQPKRRPEACFYTEDHYASFRLIAQ